jgi:hypothetical protein
MSEYGVPSKDFIGQRSSPRFLFVAGALASPAREVGRVFLVLD